MKRTAVIVLAAAGLAIGLPATGQPPAPAAATPQQAPQVPWANKFFLNDIAQNPKQLPPPVILKDFGEVPHGTICSHTFKITNIYDEPMQVVEVRKSCHCLDYVPMTQVLKPNESAPFTVTMNTGKFVGHNAQTFYVTFGPNYVSTAVLRMQATSKSDVTLNPGAVAFGTVALGSKPTQSIKVEYKGKNQNLLKMKVPAWKILGVAQSPSSLAVQVRETNRGRLFGDVEYQVDVTLKPEATPGQINEQIVLTTNDPANPVVQVAVTGSVQAPLEVAPNSVRFDTVPVGQLASQRVIVRAGKPFRIVKVEGEVEGQLTVEVPPPAVGPVPVNVLTVKFQPSQPGPLVKLLRIHTDLDGGVTANLPIEGEGSKP